MCGQFLGADTGPNPTDRGKTGSKHHLLVETRHGLPLACHVTAANVPDVKAALATVDAMPTIGGKRGGPERKPGVVIADEAYDAELSECGVRSTSLFASRSRLG